MNIWQDVEYWHKLALDRIRDTKFMADKSKITVVEVDGKITHLTLRNVKTTEINRTYSRIEIKDLPHEYWETLYCHNTYELEDLFYFNLTYSFVRSWNMRYETYVNFKELNSSLFINTNSSIEEVESILAILRLRGDI